MQERFSGRQEAHATGRTDEERRADLCFERLDLTAQWGLRDVQLFRGAAHVSFFGNGHEVADLGEAHWGSIPKRYWIGERCLCMLAGMGIEILTPDEIVKMRQAGRAAADTLAYVAARIRPGITTGDIDRWVREDTARRGGKPSQLGYKGFPAAVCTSRNSVVCHGIPRDAELLVNGDIVNVDVTTNLAGYHGDTSATFLVGRVEADAVRLVEAARRCRDAGIAVVRDQARLGDIGAAIAEQARKEGVSVVTELGGHGIGRKMHLDPHVPHTGKRGAGIRLRAGMALTIEPMVNQGRPEVVFHDDGWTVTTADGTLSAQWEHTVIVTTTGCELTTAP